MEMEGHLTVISRLRARTPLQYFEHPCYYLEGLPLFQGPRIMGIVLGTLPIGAGTLQGFHHLEHHS